MVYIPQWRIGHKGKSEDSSLDNTDGTHIADENRLGDEIDQVEAEVQLYGL